MTDQRTAEASSTKDELEAALNQIEWSIQGVYPNAFIYDHNKKRTSYRVMSDRLELSGADEYTATCFHFNGAKVELLSDGDAVGFGTKKCFVLFMNHELKKMRATSKHV